MISPHGGHRERVRKRFREEGLEHFEDHQVLELLLFYVIPRGDTNVIAHELLKQFGSLSAVLNAPIGELVKVPGIGEQAALFLTLMPQFFRRYQKDLGLRESREPVLNSVETVSTYARSLMLGRPEEVFYVLCLDVRCRLLKAVLISEGTSRETAVYPSKVA
ncbi:MAG: RadC family protein, partial [Deltaproteobacteria bacterium]|nr:RadC family protein [Deltaproteobacteria bacterium]